MIIHSICVSAVKISVESVIESFTSKFEIHLMMVSVNGPSPPQYDKVVMATMKQHFKGQHGIRFVRRLNNISLFDTVGVSSNSKVVNRILQEKSRLTYMQ
jgi:hypothetical protein